MDANADNQTLPSDSVRRSIVVARVLLAVAMTAAGYLAWVSLSGGSVVGCGPSSPCDKVLQSRWAYWLGLPVTLPALGVYMTLLAVTFGIRAGAPANRQRKAWWGAMALSVTVVGAALWFIGLQVLVLKSFCKFCMTAHACGLIGAVLLLANAPIRSSVANSTPIGVRAALVCGVVGIMAVLILAAGQILVETRQYQVHTPSAAVTTGPSTRTIRHLPIHDGRFQLSLDELPILGSPDAPHVVVSLFDYACSHCRVMHGIWKETQQRYGNRLAIVNLPMPLSANCNDQLKTTHPEFLNSCEYARLGLAVWRANRGAHAQFDAWMFTTPKPPTLVEVKQYAENIVGRESLERALGDEWIDSQIRTNVAIYAHNNLLMKTQKMPQAIVGRAIVIGALRKQEVMDQLLAKELGLKLEP